MRSLYSRLSPFLILMVVVMATSLFGCKPYCKHNPSDPRCAPDAGPPMCVELGQTCVDDGEPCCGFEEGVTDCFLNPMTATYSCELVPDAGGECVSPGDECVPEVSTCCPSTNPFDPPYACQTNDPEDPEATYVCTPT